MLYYDHHERPHILCIIKYHNIIFCFSRKEDDEEENFVTPIQKLTKEELREELKIFNQTSHGALLANDNDDDDTGDIQFRIEQPIKRSVCCYQYPFSFKDSSCIIS